MPARAYCVGSDHRPPSTGGSCACGMVTRIVSAASFRNGPRQPVASEVRDVLARCLHDGPGDSPAADAAASRPDGQLSDALRQRADRILAALAAAGLVVTVDGALRQAA